MSITFFLLLAGMVFPAVLQAQPAARTAPGSEVSASTVSVPAIPGRPIGLDEAYALALRRSEELARSSEAVVEAMARMEELRAVVGPQFALNASELLQQKAAGSGSKASQPLAKVSGHQTLFSGFREVLAYRAARLQGESAALALSRAGSLLYQDAAQAYMGLFSLQQAKGIRSNVRDITRARIKELQERRSVGRSRDSEVLAAESQLALVEADLEGLRGSERAAQELLKFLTGIEEDLRPREIPLPELKPMAPFLDRARGRADVESRLRDLDSAELSAAIAGRERWPVIGLDGNYYLKRTGAQQDVRWDVILSAGLPLYTGGAISARFGQAQSRRRSAAQAVSLARRKAELEVRSAQSDLESSLRMAGALEKAAGLAEKNAEAQSADYRLGMVTNLDVLGALNTLQETRLRLDQARSAAVLARVRLEVAAGGPQ